VAALEAERARRDREALEAAAQAADRPATEGTEPAQQSAGGSTEP